MGCERVPPYSPSPPSPSYSTELLPGERTVEHARRALSRPVGVYRRITDNLTIILRDQHPGCIHPTYGRRAVVQGDLVLRNTDELTSVTLKLEGLLILEKSGISVTTTLFSMPYTMWNASQGHPCPKTIPFAVIIPLTFDDGGQARHLPPTFESIQPRAVCSYSLTVEMSRPRPRQFLSLAFMRENEVVKVPFIYRPRSRPHTPMLPSDLPFMSTVKSSPEEWHQVMCTVNTTQASGLDAAQCLLFVPSVQTYALSDTIPFHIQIRGSPASLVPFLEQNQAGGVTDRSSGVAVRVYLLRHIGARIHDQSVTSTRVLGEGKMNPSRSLPSKHHTLQRHLLGEGLDCLDWDGELRCSEDATVASFTTSQLFVKDFIVLSITPRQPLKSPLVAVKHSHPIRLVTDPWSDEVDP
ncbi:hypothetical protein BU15DRAFT_43937 [Melanogaster broomeanus]|nr:hypothetical protein BU15DRAFT_43937 [Melanogaster broomeanus]